MQLPKDSSSRPAKPWLQPGKPAAGRRVALRSGSEARAKVAPMEMVKKRRGQEHCKGPELRRAPPRSGVPDRGYAGCRIWTSEDLLFEYFIDGTFRKIGLLGSSLGSSPTPMSVP